MATPFVTADWKPGFYLLGEFQILILLDDDIEKSVKVTNVQKCDFSQSWTLSFQNFPGEHVAGPIEGQKGFSCDVWLQINFLGSTSPLPPKQKILDKTLKTILKDVLYNYSKSQKVSSAGLAHFPNMVPHFNYTSRI